MDISWRFVFLINLPVAVAIVALCLRHVPETRDDDIDLQGSALDLPGAAAVVVALTGITYALTAAGQRGWDLPVISAAVVGLGAGLLFVRRELRTASPLIRLDMFGDRVFAATNVVTVLVYGALSVFFFLLVLQLQLVSGWTPLAAGTALLPVTVVMLLLSARFGGLASRVGPRPLMTAGSLLAAGAFALALRIGPHSSYLVDVLPAALALGLGLSCTVAPLTAAVLGAAPAHLAGAASGINNATARSAGLLAIAVVPTAVGLSGAGVSDAAAFDRGYGSAMVIGVALLVAAALVSWVGLPRVPRVVPESPGGPASEVLPVHRNLSCSLSAPALHPRGPRPGEQPPRPTPPSSEPGH